MATFTADQAADDFPVFQPEGAGHVGFAYGVIEVGANPSDGDLYKMCKLPAGAKVIDGFIRADDLDTGTEALDMDIGWAGNGVDAADPDGFGNLGVWTGDAVTGIKPETQIFYPFNGVLKDGPKEFSAETVIQIEANAAANAGGTGTIYVGVYYITA